MSEHKFCVHFHTNWWILQNAFSFVVVVAMHKLFVKHDSEIIILIRFFFVHMIKLLSVAYEKKLFWWNSVRTPSWMNAKQRSFFFFNLNWTSENYYSAGWPGREDKSRKINKQTNRQCDANCRRTKLVLTLAELITQQESFSARSVYDDLKVTFIDQI